MDRFPPAPRRFHLALAATALLASAAAPPTAADDAARVVASIRPVHSLVSAVMAGVGEPHLVMRKGASHHSFDMRPSDAAVLQEAGIVFLVDEAMESGLAGAIDTLASDARVIELSAARGLVRRPLRSGGTFEEDPFHEHDDHGDEDHGDDDHGHGHSHAHKHDDGHDHDHDHDHEHAHEDEDHHDHDHGPFDLHVWLDPVNAEAMAHMIADTLSEAAPANAAVYEDNAHDLIHRLEHLAEEIEAEVAPVRGRPFIVFHDGYRYFEERFGLTAAGSAVVSSERTPGVRRIRELRQKVAELGVVCLIDEPHFDRRLINTVIEGTDVRSGTVDPMGATVDSGPDLYFTMLRNMGAAFRDCLTPSG